MKAEFDKEIDSLLRSRARRGRAASGDAGAGVAPPSAHLDADEQSAYAENALPAIARAQYAAHLADCDDCRRNVTQLALAAGMPAQLEPREAATGQAVSSGVTWRERLGALFAPRAWRYAVPALALLLVGAVSLIVLTRRPQGETSVARRTTPNAQETAQPEAHHAPQNGNTAITTTTATPGGESAAVAPDSDASPAKEEIAANNPRPQTVQPSVTDDNDAPPPPPPAPLSGSGTVADLQMPTPTPAPPVDAVTVTGGQQSKTRSGEPAPELARIEQKQGGLEDRQYDNRQYENRRDQISGPRRNEQARNTRNAEADDSRNRADKKGENSTAATAVPASPPAAAAAMRRSRQREAEDSERSGGGRAESAAETRTVAGRKFRRQGSAWLDTAYNAGQSYTVVRRNSEQFRALVADEPSLGRIAATLGGEVTVVWKGRAYRIR